jgi:hypothetical protein
LTRGAGVAGRASLGVALVLAAAGAARAQDREPEALDDRLGRGGHQGTGANAATPERLVTDEAFRQAPPSPYDYEDEAPAPDAPAGSAPGKGEPAPQGEAGNRSVLDGIETQFDGRIRLEMGYDSNVFRSERGHSGDSFFHGLGEGNALVRFPGESELWVNGVAEGFHYLDFGLADEMYASCFADYYHPLGSIFDLDFQNTVEYSRQNLLDDNGDLLPRQKYNAIDEEFHAAVIAHLGKWLSWDAGAGYRVKHFDPTVGLPSLDFQEIRGDTGLKWKIPWWPDGRLKVRYIFRDREYFEFQAALRNGTSTPSDPKLELQRHQVKTTYSQKVELFDMVFTAALGYTFTYNQDTFQNDRSYREHAISFRLEWWIVKEWTKLEFELRAGTRSFLVRRTILDQPLRQRYLDVSMLFSQKIIEHLSLVGELGWYIYHSDDPGDSYGRLLVQGGIEASF